MVADRASFEGFYRENLARVVKACTLILLDRSTAEDVAAEAFTRLWSRWGVIGDDDHAGGLYMAHGNSASTATLSQMAGILDHLEFGTN